MPDDDNRLTQRALAVAQAVANLRARGVEPHPEVLALYAGYARGELSHEQVHAALRQRAEARQVNRAAARRFSS